jgi:chaperonin GroES
MPDQLQPIFDYLVVKELEREEVRESGLVLPANRYEAQMPPHHGIVLAAGPGLDWWGQHDIEMPVKVGDHVVFPANAGAYVDVHEEKLLVLRVGQVFGVIVPQPGSAADAIGKAFGS